jgi:hypothetical protein
LQALLDLLEPVDTLDQGRRLEAQARSEAAAV